MGHEHGHGHGGGDDHGHHGHAQHGPEGAHRSARHDRHRNPVEFERYLAKLEGPDRAAWQKPDRLVAALGLRPGDVACDVGAGPGYLALRMAREVGPRGAVYAIDVEPRMIAALRQRAREAGIENVRAILAPPGRGALPPRLCHVILVVNAFHHFPGGAAYLKRLSGRLAPGGRIVNVDFHRRELPVGPPLAHLVSRDEFLAEAREAGLSPVRERRFLPYQYFVELAPLSAPAPRRPAAKPKASARARSAPPRRPSRAAPRRAARSTR
jgi:ubiquinone/menaquinone biosynthesis C-methylase UbiE